MSQPPISRETYLKHIEDVDEDFLIAHQKELAKQPFAEEIWNQAFNKHWTADGCMMAIMRGDLKPENLPDARKLFFHALNTHSGCRLHTVSSLRNGHDFPFHDEAQAFLTQRFQHQDKAIEFLDSFLSFHRPYPKEIPQPFDASLHQAAPYAARNMMREDKGTFTRNSNAEEITAIINAMHEEKPGVRFHLLSQMKEDELFTLIARGRTEMYTSTFQEASRRLFDGLKAPHPWVPKGQNRSLTAIISRGGESASKDLLPFLEACASYGAMDKVVAALTPQQLNEMTGNVIRSVRDHMNVETALTLNEIMKNNTDPTVRTLLEDKVQQAYLSSSGPARDLFGLIAHAYGETPHGKTQPFFRKLATEPRFQPDPQTGLTHEQLVDKQQRHWQASLFYNDKDGHASFTHMMEGYADKKKYAIVDHGAFLEITNRSGPVKLHVLAGKPEEQATAMPAIDHYLKQQHASLQSFVHRGHSYHLEDSLKALGMRDIPLALLGSCGGYKVVGHAVEHFPKAHAVVTQGTGTMFVNDHLLREINDRILSGQSIQWDSFWKDMEKQSPDGRFKQYVNPHHNDAVHFIQRFETLKQETKNAKHALHQIALPSGLQLENSPMHAARPLPAGIRPGETLQRS